MKGRPKYLAYKFKIVGKTWTAYFCTPGYYKKKCGSTTIGLCSPDTKEIFYLGKRVSSELVTHELLHAYLDEACITPVDVTVDQLEEMYCELIGKHGKTIVRQADQIVTAYEVLKRRVEGGE